MAPEPNNVTPPAPNEPVVNLPPSVDDPVSKLTRAVEEQGRTIQSLRAQVATPPSVGPQPAAPPSKKDLEKQFWENPLDMVAAITQHAVQSAQASQGTVGLDTLVESAKQAARGADPQEQQVWDKFYLEIEAKVSEAVQPQFRASVNVWKNAFNLVKGEHMSEIVKMRAAALAPPAPAAGGPAPPSPKAAPAPKEDPLSSEEKDIARKLDLTEEAYRRGKAAYANQPGKVAPCAWDEVITFDSQRRRRMERANANASRK